MREMGVFVVEADQCMFGLKTWGQNKSQLMLAKKPTRFMTNSQVPSTGTRIGEEMR